mgnify:CR=1 FL=1
MARAIVIGGPPPPPPLIAEPPRDGVIEVSREIASNDAIAAIVGVQC